MRGINLDQWINSSRRFADAYAAHRRGRRRTKRQTEEREGERARERERENYLFPRSILRSIPAIRKSNLFAQQGKWGSRARNLLSHYLANARYNPLKSRAALSPSLRPRVLARRRGAL